MGLTHVTTNSALHIELCSAASRSLVEDGFYLFSWLSQMRSTLQPCLENEHFALFCAIHGSWGTSFPERFPEERYSFTCLSLLGSLERGMALLFISLVIGHSYQPVVSGTPCPSGLCQASREQAVLLSCCCVKHVSSEPLNCRSLIRCRL